MIARFWPRTFGSVHVPIVLCVAIAISIHADIHRSMAGDVSTGDAVRTNKNNGSAEAFAKLRVVGYLPEYRANAIRDEWFQQLTDLILFSAEPSADGTLDISRISAFPLERITKMAKQSGTRVLLCVGGWGRSDNFGAVCSDITKRTAFVQSAVATCLSNKFNGLDLDWEHPKNKQEEADYASLLRALKTAFQPHNLHLSVTMAAWQSLPMEAFKSVDWVQVMAYDHDGRHSTFEGALKDLEKMRVLGAPSSKLVLGIPLYGRSLKDRNKAITYQELISQNHLKPEEDEFEEFYFNGIDTIRQKCDYSTTHGLAGVMFWEIAQDATGDQSALHQLKKHLTTRN